MRNSVNRDPRQFADGETFDRARYPNRHTPFGDGIDFCVGTPTSRFEGELVLTTLLHRAREFPLPDSERSKDLTKPNSRVLTSLEVRF